MKHFCLNFKHITKLQVRLLHFNSPYRPGEEPGSHCFLLQTPASFCLLLPFYPKVTPRQAVTGQCVLPLTTWTSHSRATCHILFGIFRAAHRSECKFSLWITENMRHSKEHLIQNAKLTVKTQTEIHQLHHYYCFTIYIISNFHTKFRQNVCTSQLQIKNNIHCFYCIQILLLLLPHGFDLLLITGLL